MNAVKELITVMKMLSVITQKALLVVNVTIIFQETVKLASSVKAKKNAVKDVSHAVKNSHIAKTMEMEQLSVLSV